MLQSQRNRSVWLGIIFLGLATFFALSTIFFALTDYRLADVGFLSDNANQTELEQPAVQATPTGTTEPTPEPAYSPELLPEDLELSAQAAYVVHPASESVLLEQDADEPVQPASTVKILTALTVLEYAEPEEVIEVAESDVVDPVEESSMGLQAGDRVTVHDLLVGLMLPSGNDAASALSRTIGERVEGDPETSPDERFLDAINATADEIGLDTTHVLHSAGHDREGQAVTARELAIATEELLSRPSLEPIVAMREAEIRIGGPNARVLQIENTNELLVHDEVFGVKTGTTPEAGECLVVAYRDGDEVLIGVILGSQDRYGDARTLFDLPEPPPPEEDEDEDVEESA